MREILLMRHAKSEHPAGIVDRDRPLSARGRRSADAVGRTLTAYSAVPDRVISSPARRALDTADIASRAGGWEVSVEVIDDFYGTGVSRLLAVLSTLGGSRILAVGHEPTWSMAVTTLIGGGAVRMVTAAVACVETPTPLRPGSGVLRWMLHPRLVTG